MDGGPTIERNKDISMYSTAPHLYIARHIHTRIHTKTRCNLQRIHGVYMRGAKTKSSPTRIQRETWSGGGGRGSRKKELETTHVYLISGAIPSHRIKPKSILQLAFLTKSLSI